MAISNSFYSEIFEKENYCSKLAEKKLLNIYYLDGKTGLKGFYENKKIQLEEEYMKTNNKLQQQFLLIINNIIDEIDKLVNEYKKGNSVDLGSLVNSFLSNQMNGNNNENNFEVNQTPILSQENKQNKNDQIKERIINSLRDMYSSQYNEDYIYDDFDQEVTGKSK